MASSAVRALAILLTLAAVGCGVPTETVDGGPTTPEREDEELPSLYAGYDPSAAPHWRHLRMQMTDYRIQYLTEASARSAEYAWSAEHFDRLILDWGDTRSVPEYRRVMPRAELYRYVVTWTVAQLRAGLTSELGVTYYAHMQQWYARHPEYQLENAFLHDATRCNAAAKSPACRLSIHIWSTDRWMVNPGDAGLRAYNRERLATVASDVDGLFVDEHSSGDMVDRLKPRAILEYPDWSAYERDVVQLLRDIRLAVGGKRLLLNTYSYATPWDVQMTAAGGGAHAEAFNDPVHPEMESRWRHVEAVLAAGASLNMLPRSGDVPAGYTAGSFDTPTARRRIWELASYYLVAPENPGLLFFNSIGDRFDQPFAANWLAAVQANIGAPVGARRVTAEGVDGTGRRYRVWAREYERALVLVRPVIEWGSNGYGDATAVRVPLPATERFRPLRADGGVDAAVESVELRASEAAILVKESRVAGS